MSILVEIATRADVSVEGVVRVIMRESVSDVVKQRVLAVLDELTPAQTRILERFALAGVHDVSESGHEEPPDEHEPQGPVVAETALALPGPVVRSVAEPRQTGDEDELREADMLAVRLVTLLEELVGAIADLKSASTAERRERVDDLAVLVDLITTGWQGVDRRLGHVERVVSRLETDLRPPPMPAIQVELRAPEASREAEAPPAAEEAPADLDRRSVERRSSDQEWAGRRWPAFVAVTVLGIAIVVGFLALLGRLPSRDDLSSLVPGRSSPSSASSTGDPQHGGPPPGTLTDTGTRTEAPATTSTPPARTTTSATTTAKAPAQKPRTATGTSGTAKQPTTPAPAAIQPARTWAWAPVPKATYYTVEFRRDGRRIYQAVSSQPRLTLPSSVVFSPGAYQWVVRPGFGNRSEQRLGKPVVNSSFAVA